MASPYKLEVTLSSAKDLKNVNWRHGSLKPYAVIWVDQKAKCSTKVDEEGDTCPLWNETLVIPLLPPIEDSTLFIDVVHDGASDDTKPLIGSARLPLSEVGLGELESRTLKLKRPSGRPQGKVEVKVCIRDPHYHAPDPYYAPPGSKGYTEPAQYGNPYAAPPPPSNSYYPVAPPAGYPYDAYSQSSYSHQQEEKSKSKYGMGTGLAVGVAAGALGGLALAEGFDYVEDEIADDVADKVEDDTTYDDDDF